MQHGKYRRKMAALRGLLLVVLALLFVVGAQVVVYAAADEVQAENEDILGEVDLASETELADAADLVDEDNGLGSYEPIMGWACVDVGGLDIGFGVSLYDFRLVSFNDGVAVAMLSLDAPMGEFFATSTNMVDWEIKAPAADWFIYYDGGFYWYADGFHRTTDWRYNWQTHASPPGEGYDGYVDECAWDWEIWESTIAHVFDNFDYVSETPSLALSLGGILRIERLPFMVSGGLAVGDGDFGQSLSVGDNVTVQSHIAWIGFVITDNAGGDTRRRQLRIFADGILLNPLPATAEPVIAGIEGFAWARDAIEFTVARDLMDMYLCPHTGMYIDFNPTGSVTRGDVLAAAVRALGLVAPSIPGTENAPFEDVPLWGRGLYIDIARRMGLVSGIGNNQFAPDRVISRQDMMTMLYNILLALGQIQPDYELTALGRFSDLDEISVYARLPISSLARAGIIAGTGVTINPRGYMTRVEAAMFVWNLYRVGN